MSAREVWCLELLGQAAVVSPAGRRTQVSGRQAAAVLALLWDEQRAIRRDELAQLLWGDDGALPNHWAGAVRGVVSKVRQTLNQAGLDADALRVGGGTVELRLPEGATTDVSVAADQIDQAVTARRDGDAWLARRLAGDAATQLAKPLALQGESDWLRRLQMRVTTQGGEARRTEIEAILELGRGTEAVSAAQAAILADPLDEIAHGLLVRALLADHRPAAARRAHGQLASVLHDEFGAEPDPEVLGAIAAWSPPKHTAPKPGVEPLRCFGRQSELAALRQNLDEVVRTGRPGLALVEGPAGIGKTHLVQTFLQQVEARVLWGRCRLQSGVAFEPFAEAFGRLFDSSDLTDRSDLGSARAGLARLLPKITSGHPGVPSDDARGVVLTDIVGAVRWWAGSDPLVVVIDDMQWASGDTMALVGRILEDVGAPVLVVATVREGVTCPPEMVDILRSAPTNVLPLAGLGRDDLLDLCDELLVATDSDLGRDDLAQLLIGRTGGLPYYLVEVVRDMRARRVIDTDALPEPVRAWVRRRVETLPEDLAALLELAAVVGGRLHHDVVEACWRARTPPVLEGLEHLVNSGFLAETSVAGVLAFPHEIAREVVEGRIGSTRRAQLHRRVADVLLERGGDEPPHGELARHYGLAGPDASSSAVEHGFQAAARSLVRSAWSLADSQLVGSLDHCRPDDEMERAGLLVALGRTRHMLGRHDQAAALLAEACDLTVRQGLAHHLARATLQLVGRGGRGAALDMGDDERVQRLRVALDAVVDWPDPDRCLTAPGFAVDDAARAWLRTALEAELAWALLFTGTFDERSTLVRGALRRARSGGAGPAQLAQALLAQRNILQGPGDVPARLAATEAVLDIAAHDVPAEVLVAAHLGRHEDLLSLGESTRARDALDSARQVAHERSLRYWQWAVATWDSLRLAVYEDMAAAEVALFASADYQPTGSPEVAACTAVQLVGIRLHQGRSREVVGAVAASVDANPLIPCYRAVLALCQVDAGDLVAAQTTYESFSKDRFEMVPVDSNRLLTVAALGDVAASLADCDGAQQLDAMLEPDDDLHVVLNCYGGGGAYWGPVSRVRGRLAEVLGRDAEAARAFTRSQGAMEELGVVVTGLTERWGSRQVRASAGPAPTSAGRGARR